MASRFILCLASVLLASVSACRDDTFPTQSRPTTQIGLPPIEAISRGTIDEEYRALAETVPGFGGLYSNGQGTIHVYLRDVSTVGAATPLIASFVRRLRMVRDNAPLSVVAEQGQFDFVQLVDMYARVRQSLPASGITQTGIDKRQNKIMVGVLDATIRDGVATALRPLGAPDGMIDVRVIAPTIGTQTVQSQHSPMIGGIQITWMPARENSYARSASTLASRTRRRTPTSLIATISPTRTARIPRVRQTGW